MILVPDDFDLHEWAEDYPPEVLKANGFKDIEIIHNVPSPPTGLMAEIAKTCKGVG